MFRNACTTFAAAAAITLSFSSWAESDVQPVLMVISNQDFYHQEYHSSRQSLEAAGLEVVVAAATTETATGQGADGGYVRPDLALADVEAEDYSAIVFIGGYGSASYQYANETTYDNPAYNRPDLAYDANRVINDFVKSDKPVGAVCYGVSVLAWARVDGVSPIEDRVVVGFAGGTPAFTEKGYRYDAGDSPMRHEIEANGAIMLTSSSIGDPMTATDDVWVDGNIITAENHDSAALFARTILASINKRR